MVEPFVWIEEALIGLLSARIFIFSSLGPIIFSKTLIPTLPS
jgi:hypothetical protein